MTEINEITAILALAMMGFVLVGFIPLFNYGLAKWAKVVVHGFFIFISVVMARSIYWDIVQNISGDYWQTIRTTLGGQKFSAVFNIGIIYACYVILKGRLLLIPEESRHNWRWWNAWLHPRRLCRFRFLNPRGKDDE